LRFIAKNFIFQDTPKGEDVQISMPPCGEHAEEGKILMNLRKLVAGKKNRRREVIL
jgi:hypothetical protein